MVTGGKDKAGLLNLHFTSVFNDKVGDFELDEIRCLGEPFVIKAKNVRHRISKLQNRKSCGPDNIPN
jgi:hypothetical protein